MDAEPRKPLLSLPIAGQRRERSDAAANRARILHAARAVLAEHGAAGLTMNAVAAAAGVGKGTVFRRFGDREGLTAALLDDDMRDFQDRFLHGPPPLGPGAPPAERLEAFIIALLRHQDADLELVLAAEAFSGRVAPPVYATLLVHVGMLVHELDPTLDADVVSGLLLSAIAPPVLRRLRRDLGAEVDVVEASTLALLRGITRPGSWDYRLPLHRRTSRPPERPRDHP